MSLKSLIRHGIQAYYLNEKLSYLHHTIYFFNRILNEKNVTVRSVLTLYNISPALTGINISAVSFPTLYNLFTSDHPLKPDT